MKLSSATIVAGSMLSATPAFAAPQWVEDRCWAAAIRVRPFSDLTRWKPTLLTASPTGRPEHRRPKAAGVTTATDLDWRWISLYVRAACRARLPLATA
jgi:hypothetical protein